MQEHKKVEAQLPAAPASTPAKVEAPHDVVEEKAVIPPPETKTDESKPLAVADIFMCCPCFERQYELNQAEVSPDSSVKKISGGSIDRVSPDSSIKKISGGSNDRDIALAKLESDKRLSFIRAWEESEKSKVDNKAQKKLSAVTSWENSKKANVEAQLKKKEEQLEKKRADYAEKMKNKIALIHKQAEEKRAMIEARRGEDLLKAEEMAAKHRATGNVPKKFLGCF